MRKFIIGGFASLWLLALCSCGPSPEEQARTLENEIRATVLKETAALASLTCIFRVTFTSYKERLVLSDDIYVQQDEAALDYGYRLDEESIRVVFEDGRNVPRVRLTGGELLGTDRKTLRSEKTHASYRPSVNIDAAMNQELESLKKEYGQRALREAAQNIKNFFRIIAAKYGLELDFKLE